MVDVKDRVPTKPGRVKLIHDDGTFEYVTLERADEPVEAGTSINKVLFDDIYYEIENKKALCVEDEVAFDILADSSETLEKEYELDNTRLIYIMFSGQLVSRTIECVMIFDCATNKVIALNNYASNSLDVVSGDGASLAYTNFAYSSSNYTYSLRLSSITYNQDIKKLNIQYLKKNTGSNTQSGNFTMKLYGISGKI